MSHHRCTWIRLAFSLLSLCGSITAPAATPSDQQIRQLIEQRVRVQKWATGIVVGITDAKGRRILSYGTLAAGDPRPVQGDTVFEIASLTKVFTSLLLADMARRGEVAVDDPVAKCLPADQVKIPQNNGRQITFADLATHTSGLPLRPTNLKSQTALDKYAGYTAAEMYAALSSYTPEREIGTHFQYSNWGVGLLGHALARCAGKEFALLLHERVTAPLGMHDTRFHPTPAMQKRLASGHDLALTRVGNQGRGVLDPAGGLYSTANDLLTLLEMFTGKKRAAIRAAAATMLDVRRPTDDPSTQMALGWRISTRDTQRTVWSNGRADGYRAYMAYDPDARIGIVALANAATNIGADDIGQYFLDPRNEPVQARERKDLSVEVLERYVGSYRFDDGNVMTISRNNGLLISHMTDQAPIAIHASTERQFYPEEIEAEIEFEQPQGKHAPAMVLRQDGQSHRAVRID